MYKANDVCIVGRGAVYAGSWSASEMIENLFEGKSSITDMRECAKDVFPWTVKLVYNPDRKAEDQSYSAQGAFIDRKRLFELTQEKGLDSAQLTSLEMASLRAFDEAIAPVKDLPELRQAEIILGLSTVDTEAYLQLMDDTAEDILKRASAKGVSQEEYEEIKRHVESITKAWAIRKPWMSYVIATSLLDCLKSKFDIQGPSCLSDAACASSFSAMHLAIKKLKQGEADMVITGGADVSVSPGCLVFFSRLGAMSPERTLPFDKEAAGLTQGEGVGIFVLMRLQDAIDRKLPIHAVLRSCEGASDGRASGIVEPTSQGQMLAYQRAYAAAGVSEVDYIEAHGTGTVVGDRTEIESLSQQFPKKRLPIGSVKANVGHTIAAAGAAGLIKTLGVIQKKAVPPSPHFTRYPDGFKTQLFLNKEVFPLPERDAPVTVGLSSFGFGGSNFHMVAQEYRPTEPVIKDEAQKPSPVVLCGSVTHSYAELEQLSKLSKNRLPPNIVPWIDKTQRMAILTVESALRTLGIVPELIDRDRVSVVSSSMIPLENYWESGRRVVATVLRRDLAPKMKNPTTYVECMDEIIGDKLRITEDSLHGFLNNVIAGRICNVFDFRGVNFNIDSDLAGSAAAMRMARTMLTHSHGMVIVVSAAERVKGDETKVERDAMTCSIFASAAYALEHDLPIAQIFKAASYQHTPAERGDRNENRIAAHV